MLHVSSHIQPFFICRWDEAAAGGQQAGNEATKEATKESSKEALKGAIQFPSHSSARDWLGTCQTSLLSMSVLREALRQFGGELSVLRANEAQVIDELAWLIVSTRVLIVPERQDLPNQGGSFGTSAPAAAPPPVAKTRAAPVAPPPSEENTLPKNTDAGAMAATLIAAAANGVPFCEICEKQKKERQQTAEATA